MLCAVLVRIGFVLVIQSCSFDLAYPIVRVLLNVGAGTSLSYLGL